MKDFTELLGYGVDFDDLSSDFVIESNKKYEDLFQIPNTQKFFIRDFTIFSSGVRGKLEIKIDGRIIFKTTTILPPYLQAIPLNINEFAEDNVEVSVSNQENIDRVVSYTFRILRIPEDVFQQVRNIIEGRA